MGYKDKIKVRESRILNDSIECLTAEEWGSWIEDHLHERKTVPDFRFGLSLDGGHPLVGGIYESLRSPFTELVPCLPLEQRQLAYGGIVSCLDRTYQEREKKSKIPSWNDNTLEELLFLVSEIEYREVDEASGEMTHQDLYFAERSGILTRFLDVVAPKPAFRGSWTDYGDVYCRVLDALRYTETKLSFTFWLARLQLSRSVYALPCFHGASINSPYDAIELLPHIDWSNSETRDWMKFPLFVFSERNIGNQDVIAQFEKKKEELSINDL